ncbi:serine protease grass [Drosophila erecta]|uniref:serine protease grass n=1 Tax=Drosophila erecta TaxID=7220 RepID=UPI0007326C88|nr:serine protease grass [Drosophila erecta]KQS52148.1 uncharacterized protein Dere_GG26631 [Drosophila erecta]
MSAALWYAIFALLLFHQGSTLYLEQNCGIGSVFSPNPWLVKILPDPSSNITCTGSLINERFVLTAASCIDNKTKLLLRLGEGFVRGYSKYQYEEISATKAIVHRLYTSTTYEHNIALVRLATSVVYKKNIKPICIIVNVEKVPKAPTFEIEIKKSEVPKKDKVNIFKQFSKWISKFFTGTFPDQKSKVNKPPEALAIGSPLTKKIDNSEVVHQYGILSHHNTETMKDVYTNVMAYADWIIPIALDVHIIMA